jgi:hypothetical protein
MKSTKWFTNRELPAGKSLYSKIGAVAGRRLA